MGPVGPFYQHIEASVCVCEVIVFICCLDVYDFQFCVLQMFESLPLPLHAFPFIWVYFKACCIFVVSENVCVVVCKCVLKTVRERNC